MMSIGSLPKGAVKSFPLQVMQEDTVTPSTKFLAGDVLAVKVWPGDDLPATCTPAAAWTDAATAKYSVNFVALDTLPAIVPPATTPVVITPGIYRIRATATRNGATVEILRDSIEILATEGAGVAGAVYCTYEDMACELNWIKQFQSDDEDQTGFLEQRVKARQWMDSLILRAAPVSGPGALISRQAWWSWANSGVDPRNGTGLAIDTVLEGYLAANCLMITGARGMHIVTACSCYAIALVLRAQPGFVGEQARLAGYFMRRAQAEASLVVAEVDINGDNRAEYAISLGTTNTRFA